VKVGEAGFFPDRQKVGEAGFFPESESNRLWIELDRLWIELIAYGSSQIAYGSSENGSPRLICPAGAVSPRVRARVRAGLIARAHELELGLELDL
jgi:hypothetical protein